MKRILTVFLVMLLAVGVLGTACKHEHEYTKTVIDSTCQTKGYTEYVCSCGDKYRDNYVEKLDHKFTNYVDNGNNSSTATCDYGCGRVHTIYGENFDWTLIFTTNAVGAITGLTEYGKTLSYLYVPSEINGKKVNYVIGKKDSTEAVSKQLKYLEIADGILELREKAFWGCSNLKTIDFGGVTNVYKEAFAYCERLEEITSFNKVEIIGESAFLCCMALEKIDFGKNLREIGANAFEYCRWLSTISFEGTSEEWNAVEKGMYWTGMPAESIISASFVECADGSVNIYQK